MRALPVLHVCHDALECMTHMHAFDARVAATGHWGDAATHRRLVAVALRAIRWPCVREGVAAVPVAAAARSHSTHSDVALSLPLARTQEGRLSCVSAHSNCNTKADTAHMTGDS